MSDAYNAATHIDVDADVRYWEDGSVNGLDEDNDTPTMPGAKGNTWYARIELATGRIEGWPVGTEASIHYKVCDEGLYWLSTDGGERIAKWRGHYVPDEFLCHSDKGYGDYIIMDVGSDGLILNYTAPEIDPGEWAPPSGPDKADAPKPEHNPSSQGMEG